MGLCSLPVIYLGPNYCGGNEDNGNLQKVPCIHCYTQCPQPCSRPPPTHTSAGNSRTRMGKSGSVSCGGHCSFLLGPGVHKFLFVPSNSLFPQSCVSSVVSMVGLMVTSSKRAYATPRSTADPSLHRRHSNTVLSWSLCPGVHKVCLGPLMSLAGMGFDSKCDFAPPTILLGLLL